MKTLIAFEKSQKVCGAFLAMGHDAYSCDLQETTGEHPDRHLIMDAEEAIFGDDWDFVGMHPVCTAMTNSGNKHYGQGTLGWAKRNQAVNNTIDVWLRVLKRFGKAYMGKQERRNVR